MKGQRVAASRQNRYLRDIPLPGLDEGVSGYRGPAVCKIVGISYRQLDYWTTTGLVQPSVRSAEGSGSQRLYAFDDVLQLKIVKNLLDTGVSLQRIRAAIEYVRERGLSLRSVTLMSDGQTVYAADDQRELIDLLQKGQGVFAIAVDPVVAELEASIARFPSERADGPVSRAAPGSAAAEGG
ncbi:MerR family transcriptional regulator [soil metagenome]